jgi:hypothetical protein
MLILLPKPSFALGPTPTPKPITVLYPVTKDSYVDSALPTSNFGTQTTMKSTGSPDRTAYVSFTYDDTLVAYKIVSARLKIRSTVTPTVVQQLYYTSQVDWSETTLNYNNRPLIEKYLTNFVTSTNAYTFIDVTQPFKYNLGSPSNTLNITFAIKSGSTQVITYPTKESGIYAAGLEVTYIPMVVAPTAVPTPMLSCSPLGSSAPQTVTGTPTNHSAAGKLAFDEVGPYRGIGETTTYSSDGGRAVWINKNNPNILYVGEWGGYAVVDKSTDGGLTWSTVISNTYQNTIGVPRDFEQVGNRVYMVTDSGVLYEESNIWYTCTTPAMGALQTIRSLRDGTLVVGGEGGVATANASHNWQVATGFASGVQGDIMIRTVVQDPDTYRLYAGGWYGYDVNPYLYDNPGLWVSDDQGVTFKRYERYATMAGSTGKLPAINSIHVFYSLGNRIIVAGTEGEGSVHGQIGSAISPSLYLNVNDQPFTNYTAVMNSAGWNTAVSAGLVTPQRGIFTAGGFLIVGSYSSHLAGVKIADLLGTTPLNWTLLTEPGFKSGLNALVGNTYLTGGQHWGSTVPAFKPVYKITNFTSQLNTLIP